MSQQEFSLLVRIKESPELKELQRMSQQGVNLGRGMGITTQGVELQKISRETEKQSGVFQRMRSELGTISKNVLPLVGIGVGIGALVAFATQASPLLVNTFKILQTGFALMIRPIADFIALILRPFTIAFLTLVAIPFMRILMPIVKDIGKQWNEAVTGFLRDPVAGLAPLVDVLVTGFLPRFFSVFQNVNWRGIFATIIEAFDKLDLGSLNLPDIFPNIGDIKEAWNLLKEFWNALKMELPGIKNTTLPLFFEIFETIKNNLPEIKNTAIPLFTALWTTIKENLPDILRTWNFLTIVVLAKIKESLPELRSSVRGIFGFVGDVWEDITTLIRPWWEDSVNDFQAIKGSITEMLKIAVQIAALWKQIKDLFGIDGGSSGGGPAPTSRFTGNEGRLRAGRGDVNINVGDVVINSPITPFEAGEQFRGRLRRIIQTEVINLDELTV